jgi:hypothetical protein
MVSVVKFILLSTSIFSGGRPIENDTNFVQLTEDSVEPQLAEAEKYFQQSNFLQECNVVAYDFDEKGALKFVYCEPLLVWPESVSLSQRQRIHRRVNRAAKVVYGNYIFIT